MKLAWFAVAIALMIARPVAASAFSVNSADLVDGGRIANAFVYRDCGGGNLSPALAWTGAPAGTRSFAVTVHDPDAPKAGGWWHWLVFDIPAATAGLSRGAANGGLPSPTRQGRNDFGHETYDGPCPPPGPAHHYVITLWGLDMARLALGAGSTPGEVAAQLRAHSLAWAQLTGVYGR